MMSTSCCPQRDQLAPSAVRVERTVDGGYEVAFLSRRQIPDGSEVWSSLRTPPKKATGDQNPDILLSLVVDFDEHTETQFDLSDVLAHGSVAYVKSGQWVDSAELRVNGTPVARIDRPGS